MLFYFLIFAVIGFFMHKYFYENGPMIIIVIALIWGIVSGAIWGLVSLGEMFLGFYIAKQMK
jgi:RsiW-degrading membrane proteinase PrsW (M82 family)